MDKKKNGRPSASEKTISKTYRFFDSDIKVMLNKGNSPKQIFRLGIYALNNNPILMARIRELEQGNDKLQQNLTKLWGKMEKKLQESKQKLLESHKNRAKSVEITRKSGVKNGDY